MAYSALGYARDDELSRSKTWAWFIGCSVWAIICCIGLLITHATFDNRDNWQTLGAAFVCLAVALNKWQIINHRQTKVRNNENRIIGLLSWASCICACLIAGGLAIYDLFFSARPILSGF